MKLLEITKCWILKKKSENKLSYHFKKVGEGEKWILIRNTQFPNLFNLDFKII